MAACGMHRVRLAVKTWRSVGATIHLRSRTARAVPQLQIAGFGQLEGYAKGACMKARVPTTMAAIVSACTAVAMLGTASASAPRSRPRGTAAASAVIVPVRGSLAGFGAGATTDAGPLVANHLTVLGIRPHGLEVRLLGGETGANRSRLDTHSVIG
jgi:hypothetical protein